MKYQRVVLAVVVLSLCCLLFAGSGLAGIPEPDHIIYGMAPDGAAVVWAMVNGSAVPLASFQMGGQPGLGGQYILRLPMDSVGVRAPGCVRSGDEVALYVDGAMAMTAMVGSRGTAQYLDLASALSGGGVTIADVTVVEGDSDTVDAVFRLTLTPAATEPVTVAFKIQGETASHAQDYFVPGEGLSPRPRPGTSASRRSAGGAAVRGFQASNTTRRGRSGRSLEFPAGTTEQEIIVKVLGDELAEPNERFTVRLTEATGARIARAEAVGIILNDDLAPVPEVLIADARMGEGGDGEDGAGVAVSVTLSHAAAQEVTVQYVTIEGLATGGIDFLHQTGAVRFAPGETEKSIPITIFDDDLPESCERFLVRLDTAANARIADGEAVVTILDDDGSALEPELGSVVAGSVPLRVDFQRVFTDPVLILGPSASRSATPSVALAGGLTGMGFDVWLEDWDGGPVRGAEEEISYLVLERGRHVMPDGSIWEAGTFLPGASGEWTALDFQEPFPGSPAVFFSARQGDGARPAVIRAGGVLPGGFESALFVNDSDERAMEENLAIGFVAVYSPAGNGIMVASGLPVPYLVQETAVAEEWQPILSWSANMRRLDGADPVGEDVTVLALGRHLFAQDLNARTDGPVQIRLQPPERELAVEWGTVMALDEGWTMVPLAKSYARPVAVAMPAMESGLGPVVLRVRNVMEDSFEVSCQSLPGAGSSCRDFPITYLVAEEGEQALAGLTLRAGSELMAPAAAEEWTDVVFADAFAAAPVVFAGLQTDHAGQPGLTLIHQRNPGWFALSLDGIPSDGKRVGWIAIEPGETITAGGRRLSVFTGAAGVQNRELRDSPGDDTARHPVILTGRGSAYSDEAGFLYLAKDGPAGLGGSLQFRSGTGETLVVPEDICVFRAD